MPRRGAGWAWVEAILGPGDLFGRLSTGGAASTLEVESLEASELAALPRQPLEVLLRKHPDLAYSVVQELEDRQQRLVRRFESLVFKDVRARDLGERGRPQPTPARPARYGRSRNRPPGQRRTSRASCVAGQADPALSRSVSRPLAGARTRPDCQRYHAMVGVPHATAIERSITTSPARPLLRRTPAALSRCVPSTHPWPLLPRPALPPRG